MFGECERQTAARRIAQPTVACRLAQYNGDVEALDIISAFSGRVGSRISKEYPALFAIDSLSRFINRSLLIARTSDHVGQTFANDWVRAIGKPRRLIADAGGLSMAGNLWLELRHIYGRGMIQ